MLPGIDMWETSKAIPVAMQCTLLLSFVKILRWWLVMAHGWFESMARSVNRVLSGITLFKLLPRTICKFSSFIRNRKTNVAIGEYLGLFGTATIPKKKPPGALAKITFWRFFMKTPSPDMWFTLSPLVQSLFLAGVSAIPMRTNLPI